MHWLGEKYNIPQSTLGSILQRKAVILQTIKINSEAKSKKRNRNGKHEQVDQAVKMFVNEARAQNVPLSGEVIKTKALEFASKLNVLDFKGNNASPEMPLMLIQP